jgi:hypothetical protein
MLKITWHVSLSHASILWATFCIFIYLTRQVNYEQILIYNDGLPKGLLRGRGLELQQQQQWDKTQITTRATPQHYIKRDL